MSTYEYLPPPAPVETPSPAVSGPTGDPFPLSPGSPVGCSPGEGGLSTQVQHELNDSAPGSPGPGAPFDLSVELLGGGR